MVCSTMGKVWPQGDDIDKAELIDTSYVAQCMWVDGVVGYRICLTFHVVTEGPQFEPGSTHFLGAVHFTQMF